MNSFFVKILLKLNRVVNTAIASNIKNQLKSCGSNVKIPHNVHIINPENVSVGDNTSISSFTTIYGRFFVTIGKNCWVSSNVGISSYNHILDSDDRHRDMNEDFKYSKPVLIGDNVLISMNVCIVPGVKIGDNSVIGAGSVVVKNVPKNELWAGVPARFIKKINIS